MEKRKRAKPWYSDMDAYIAHRCDEYDHSNFREPFESFLESKFIQPRYGCTLDMDFEGILDENVKKVLAESKMYIALITPSWDEKFEPKWPKLEWDWWRWFKEDTPELKRNCIGFFTTEDRDIAPFMSNLTSFQVIFVDKGIMIDEILEDYTTLFSKKGVKCLVEKKEKKKILDRLERMHDTARKY